MSWDTGNTPLPYWSQPSVHKVRYIHKKDHIWYPFILTILITRLRIHESVLFSIDETFQGIVHVFMPGCFQQRSNGTSHAGFERLIAIRQDVTVAIFLPTVQKFRSFRVVVFRVIGMLEKNNTKYSFTPDTIFLRQAGHLPGAQRWQDSYGLIKLQNCIITQFHYIFICLHFFNDPNLKVWDADM